MRFLTSGESHGQALVAILEGFPKGVKIDQDLINKELLRRQSGFGRGARMGIEKDRVEVLSGLRNKVTLGSPICVMVKNKDQKIFPQSPDSLEQIVIPRPAHADLAGALKYQEQDIRNILERASARETAIRVCLGSICKQFLVQFKIRIASFVVSIGNVTSKKKPKNTADIVTQTKQSALGCLDAAQEQLMVKAITKAQKEGDTLGGIVEVWAEFVPPGLGSFMHSDQRLDAKLAGYIMSMPAVKGVEIGLGFDYARSTGRASHDAIYYTARKGFYRKTNSSGGVEGGVSNGEPVVVRFALKPIATLQKPLDSIHLKNRSTRKAPQIRSDVCAVQAAGVIAESMVAIALTECFLDKFGKDCLKEIKKAYQWYLKSFCR